MFILPHILRFHHAGKGMAGHVALTVRKQRMKGSHFTRFLLFYLGYPIPRDDVTHTQGGLPTSANTLADYPQGMSSW